MPCSDTVSVGYLRTAVAFNDYSLVNIASSVLLHVMLVTLSVLLTIAILNALRRCGLNCEDDFLVEDQDGARYLLVQDTRSESKV